MVVRWESWTRRTDITFSDRIRVVLQTAMQNDNAVKLVGIHDQIMPKLHNYCCVFEDKAKKAQWREASLWQKISELNEFIDLHVILRKVWNFKNAHIVCAKATHHRVCGSQLRVCDAMVKR